VVPISKLVDKIETISNGYMNVYEIQLPNGMIKNVVQPNRCVPRGVVPISTLTDKIETKVQRLYIYIYIYVYEVPSDIQTISTLGAISVMEAALQ